MKHATAERQQKTSGAALVARARRGDPAAFRTVIQSCNQRLFRVARAILRDDVEAEDVLQESYVRAFRALGSFRGDAALPTWLTRIVVNEARGRLRRRRETVTLDTIANIDPEEARVIMFPSVSSPSDPESAAARGQIRRMIERAIDTLPEPFRLVFVLREVEELSVNETASLLNIKAETVKTRLHRARRLLQKTMDKELGAVTRESFPFLGSRCERLTEKVMARLAA